MNLLMSNNNVNIKKLQGKSEMSNFELLSLMLPPLSCKFRNGQDTKENNKIFIKNGEYIGGQLDKRALGSTSIGLIQSIFNDFGFKESGNFINNLQNLITDYMKLSAYSVGISDLIANEETNRQITEAITQKKTDVQKLINETRLGIFENKTGKSNEVEFETKVNSLLNEATKTAGGIGRKVYQKIIVL